MKPRKLEKYPIHLGLNATSAVLPEFTGSMEWYADYAQSTEADGKEGRLVTMHTFSESWGVWEMHPAGSEVVVCTKGSMILHQEFEDGEIKIIKLTEGEFAINPLGVWHTADVETEATALFITAGQGTQHKLRESKVGKEQL